METDAVLKRFNEVAESYDDQRRYFIPCFDDYYKTSTSFLARCRMDIRSILDLGAGTGLLSKYLLDNYPEARFSLVDVSDKMLEIAKQRFTSMKNFEFIVSDYSKELPSATYDLIASALSIHHLNADEKTRLYSSIYNRLNESGLFLNLDQFNATDKIVNDYYNNWWYEYIHHSNISIEERDSWLKRRELDKESTIPETLTLLKEIGFKAVECIYSFMKFGVILAIK